MRVNDIMNKVIAIEPSISLKHASQIMSKRGIGCLVVLRGKKIAGIITERDIMKNIGSLGKKVSGAMSKQVITINHKDSIDNAALLMSEHKIKKLPILDNKKLVGIVTATDIIANSDILNEDFFFD